MQIKSVSEVAHSPLLVLTLGCIASFVMLMIFLLYPAQKLFMFSCSRGLPTSATSLFSFCAERHF
jgi:hypothetical protein